MERVLGFMILSTIITFAWAPLLISLLYKFNIVRRVEEDFASIVGERYLKAGTPIMGGLMVLGTVTTVSLVSNRDFTVLILLAITLFAAALGGIDDVLNIYGKKRIIRTTAKTLTLAKVHKKWYMRIYYIASLPWNIYMNGWYALGSYPGKGIHAGEKILIQVIIGIISSWFIYFKLGVSSIWMPFVGSVNIGLLMPLFVIAVVTSMANAVNISDGMDGLSSGLMTSSFVAFLIISIAEGNKDLTILNAVVVGALITYLYFNIKPARVEMGDVGTLALGTLLAVEAFVLDKAILLPVIGFLFVAEIGSSLIQGFYRKLFGKRLLKMAPLHLHFQIKGWSEEKVVMRFWIFSIFFAILGLWLSTK